MKHFLTHFSHHDSPFQTLYNFFQILTTLLKIETSNSRPLCACRSRINGRIPTYQRESVFGFTDLFYDSVVSINKTTTMSPLPTSDWCLTMTASPFLLRGIYGFACYFLSDYIFRFMPFRCLNYAASVLIKPICMLQFTSK